MSEVPSTVMEEKDDVLTDRERFHMVSAAALRATMKQKARRLEGFNQLADEKRDRLDEPLEWSAPGQQGEGDKLARKHAAETYQEAAMESGLAAADLRHTTKKAREAYEENEGVYIDAATKLATADLAARGEEPLNR